MRSVQKGFTLIELVIVIVILGILAAAALPKFIDLSKEAKQAKVDGVAGAIASSASIQYAANKANATNHLYASSDACNGVYLQTGRPTGCTGSASTAADGVTTCTVTCDTSFTATAIIP